MKGGRNSCRMLSGSGNGLSTDGTGSAHEELSAKVTPKSQSFFLFGPRGTGKSTFLDTFLSDNEKVTIDLLDPQLADELISYPNNLLARLAPHEGTREWVVIDEVQKAPQLLDIVHKLIKERRFKFALIAAGPSAT